MVQLKEHIIKLCLLGNPGVGKSTLFHYSTGGLVKDRHRSSIGANFGIKIILNPEWNFTIRLQFWDVNCVPHFEYVRPSFYKGSFATIFVFDLTNPESFAAVKTCVQESDRHVPEIPRVLLGNKVDLTDERVISRKEGENLAREIGADYDEISAKEKINLDGWLENLVDQLINAHIFRK